VIAEALHIAAKVVFQLPYADPRQHLGGSASANSPAP
jgi:hypothetical protein